MTIIKIFFQRTWEYFFVLIGVLGVLLPVSPLNMRLVYRDSGMFLYTGWRILNGDLPYLNIWDHKPPVIYYINALGLALTHNSRWGVWLIEVGSLYIAAYIAYRLIKNIFGQIPALMSSLFWLMSLVLILQGGNFTTEYTLPLQFLALWLFTKLDKYESQKSYFFLIGLVGAFAFFTKQTTIGLWVGFFIYLAFYRLSQKQGRQYISEVLWMVLGGLSITLFVFIFFWANGVISQFWDAAFLYNFTYSSRIERSLFFPMFSTFSKRLRPFLISGILPLAITGLVLSVIVLWKNKEGNLFHLIRICIITLPIELILIFIPSKTFPHYFITLIPTLAIFTASTFHSVSKAATNINIPNSIQYLFFAGIAIIASWNFFHNYLNQVYIYRKFNDDALIQYAILKTTQNDTVLVWGADPSINYFSKRESPTRFVYQYPLQEENYVTETMIIGFLDDVIHKQPRLVINIDPDHSLFSFPIKSEEILARTKTLEEMYCLVDVLDSAPIYSLRQENSCLNE